MGIVLVPLVWIQYQLNLGHTKLVVHSPCIGLVTETACHRAFKLIGCVF